MSAISIDNGIYWQSDSAGVVIPELDLELTSGTLGRIVTTVEGLVTKISENLERVYGFTYGESLDEAKKSKWLEFRSRLNKNSSLTKNQIKYFVYCMENAIMNLPVNQEQMVWLTDFDDFSLKNISVAVTRDTAHVLQEHYPKRLSVGVSTRFLADKFPLVPRIISCNKSHFRIINTDFINSTPISKLCFFYGVNFCSKPCIECIFTVDIMRF
ncbi:hypothetical protein Droror1_Dr00011927 [Drosera rotundifolia]